MAEEKKSTKKTTKVTKATKTTKATKAAKETKTATDDIKVDGKSLDQAVKVVVKAAKKE